LIIIIIIAITTAIYFNKPKQEKNIYLNFINEIYDKIQENYWEKISEEELTNIFKLASEKLTEKPQTLEEKNKQGMNKMIKQILEETQNKEQFIPQLAHMVLINLKPFNRSGLYTPKQEQELKQMVENINPETQEVETTVIPNLITPDILHLYIKRISPTTLNDLKIQTEKYDKENGPTSLIIDLRSNIGGSLDITPYLLGPFIGQNQYAFELFHKGDYEPIKTQFGWLPSLVRYKKVIILTNEKTQSSAEIMASVLKKYNVGISIGKTTKGWGTIEKVFELENQVSEIKYSMFLVHRLTLKDDNQPIEGNGVQPLINIEDKDWKDQLYSYFDYDDLINAVENIWKIEPEEIK
ncbi:MAG: S41 family peptidase, partial [Patescibacteria group bacterium]